MDNRTVLNKPDLILIRYGNMRIFPGDFIHGGGFNNTGYNGNFRIQLLIIDDGQKIYHSLKFPRDNDHVNVSDGELLCYNFGEEKEDDVSKYNNRSVRNYTYSSFKPITFCHVKKHTGVDLVLRSDRHPNAKPMISSYLTNKKLYVYKTSHSGTNINNRYLKKCITIKVISQKVFFQDWINILVSI